MLDLQRSGVHDVVRVKLHDTMRELHIYLNEGSDAYHISSGVRAVLSAKKPDGNVLFNRCDVNNDMVIYRFSGQETAVPGVTECELRLYDGDMVISSARFEILVDETSVDDEEILSLSEATELTRLMHRSEEALAKLHEIFGQNITPVSYAPQSLTLEQAAQARENIMAPGKQEFDVLERVVDQLDLHFLSLDPQELTEEQQLQLRANIDAVSSEALARLMEAVNESFGELDEQVIRSTAQTLTPEQMAQARKNIGAQGVAQVQDAVNDAITDAMSNAVQIVPQTLTEAEKARVRSNIEVPSKTAFEELEEEVTERTTTETAEALGVTMTAANYKITSTGGSLRDTAYKIERYRVTLGMRLRIRAKNPYIPALFVFSGSSTLADRIGDVYASDAETVDVTVDVPTGAAYLHINAIADENGNIVESIVPRPVNVKIAEMAIALDSAVMVTQQTFTATEKAQARRNIGAISAQEVAELVPVDATLKNAGQAADAAAVGRALGGLRFEVDPADGGLVIHYGEEEDDGND